ncbi:MAG: hypothetical protein IIB04_03100 [Acidobacteria bacterium]|nr:hypothetical protein [Acidobacteriota bacterium]MCH8985584.1 hypothetical protein [Acidobacteriota bacterium]
MKALDEKQLRTFYRIGIAVAVLGVFTAIGGAVLAHFVGLPATDSVGRELYPSIPRGLPIRTLAQTISLTGIFMLLGGITLAFLYRRQLTWARAAIGAFVFTSMVMLLFGVIPNQLLTIAQTDLDWSSQRTLFTIPRVLALNNDISISYEVLKEILVAGMTGNLLIGIPVAMVKWQTYEKNRIESDPVTPISAFGRPTVKQER